MSLPKPYYQDEWVTIYHGDCFSIIHELRNKTYFDLILTDPPYWTLNKWREVGTTTRLGGHRDESKRTGWFETIDESELWEFMVEAQLLLKPNRHAYIMADGQVLKWILGYAEEAGFSNYKPIVWDKVNQGMGYHYRCRHEYFVMLDKGKNRKLNNLSTPDVWAVKAIRADYPTEKPVELFEIPIIHSTLSSELILDPFMGSGASLEAAKKNNRRIIGIDCNESACEIAAKRCSQQVFDFMEVKA